MKTKQLIKYCNYIAIITGIYGISIFFRLSQIGYDLGKQMAISDKSGIDISNVILLEALAQIILAFGIFAVCLLFFLFVANVRRGLVFVSENQLLLMIFGIIIAGLGMLSYIINKISSSNSIFNSGLLVLIGLCFVFISFIFKIGIKMQEEQELTI